LLLDEISEMDMGLQAKLLRVLQEREVERLGGRKSIKLDVRVIATSNRDMRAQVAQGKFREDLYFRLSVLPLNWKPLRERQQDILPLAEKLLCRHAAKQHRCAVKFTDSAKRALLTHAWPGNVRELDNVVQRALILQMGSDIEDIDLGLQVESTYEVRPESSLIPNQGMAFSREQHGSLEKNSTTEGEKPILGNGLMEREYEIIMKTLRDQRGSKKKTAEALGISARTLRYKFARLRENGYIFDLY